MNPLGPPSDPADEHPSVQTTLKKETPSLTEQEVQFIAIDSLTSIISFHIPITGFCLSIVHPA